MPIVWKCPSRSFSWLSWSTCQHMGIHSADFSPNDVVKGTVNCPYIHNLNEWEGGCYHFRYLQLSCFFLYLPCVSGECHIVVAVGQAPVIDSTMDGHWFIHCMLVAVQVLHRCSMQKSFAPLWSTQGLAHLHTCVKYTMALLSLYNYIYCFMSPSSLVTPPLQTNLSCSTTIKHVAMPPFEALLFPCIL